ncbi:DUF1254 domain-containing protein [Sandaracinobacter sp. RS1-74]|uniref:DUF1254 domain-containing protein n=1 Tax=Sandaracinobacteroides sayramensis TaxID=2913411 RepID=UPI001EDA3EF8|nr:DUF1254 domain-containing protein [Sandaracinobacteroides sayramensis]MCG2839456.1 DUF1254 domain-containing protein [Sandaracinobacteroides sayramensis]
MRKLLVTLLFLALLLGGFVLWLRAPLAQTTEAALKAYPAYSLARVRNGQLARFAHEGVNGSNRLLHRPDLAGPRDRSVTTPNNDTLYSSAFLDLSAGPVTLKVPALPDRYHSVAVMDARTDNVVIVGTRDGGEGGEISLYFGDEPEADAEGARRFRIPSPEAWLLVRTLVDGPADLEAARAAQQGFVLEALEAGPGGPQAVAVLPVQPDPATLLRVVNPIVAQSPALKAPELAATGYGQGADAFEKLPVWRQWLWRLLLPRLFQRIEKGLFHGLRSTGDGWSQTPPGIGTAEASDALRAAVALAGLGALPAEEAIYWSAAIDRQGREFDGRKRYRLTVPANVPARAFWSLSLYERLPDGRLFYVDNPIDRYAVGNRTPGLVRNADGSLTLTIAAVDPGEGANWLPAPARGPFTLIFRAYLPEDPILKGEWRLPAVEAVGG